MNFHIKYYHINIIFHNNQNYALRYKFGRIMNVNQYFFNRIQTSVQDMDAKRYNNCVCNFISILI